MDRCPVSHSFAAILHTSRTASNALWKDIGSHLLGPLQLVTSGNLTRWRPIRFAHASVHFFGVRPRSSVSLAKVIMAIIVFSFRLSPDASARCLSCPKSHLISVWNGASLSQLWWTIILLTWIEYSIAVSTTAFPYALIFVHATVEISFIVSDVLATADIDFKFGVFATWLTLLGFHKCRT